MISVLLTCGKDGTLASCRAQGHARFAERGSDIVCSAVTVLLRTTMQALSGTEGVTVRTEGVFVRADASERGSLDFDVSAESAPAESRAALVYAGRFLEAGLASLVREYPRNVELKIQTD